MHNVDRVHRLFTVTLRPDCGEKWRSKCRGAFILISLLPNTHLNLEFDMLINARFYWRIVLFIG